MTKIESNLLRNLSDLEVLFIRSNKIDEIKEDSFDDLIKLKELNLRNNQLCEFKANRLLKNSPKLGSVILFNNNIDPKIISYYNQSFFTEKINQEFTKFFKDHNQSYLDDLKEFLKQFI